MPPSRCGAISGMNSTRTSVGAQSILSILGDPVKGIGKLRMMFCHESGRPDENLDFWLVVAGLSGNSF
jgi:hypothetical protein